MPSTVQRGRLVQFVKPTRQGSTILGLLNGVLIELGVIVLGWTILRWMGWV